MLSRENLRPAAAFLARKIRVRKLTAEPFQESGPAYTPHFGQVEFN